MPVPTLDRASVVLLGQFNPPIFQPAWFAQHGLIRDGEASQAQSIVIVDQLAKFKTDWLDVQVQTNRFQVFTDDSAHFNPLRDLVLGVLTLLEHTPVSTIGLNRHMHFRMESEGQWHRLGHFLAPKAPWLKVLNEPGLRALIIEGRREKAPGAQIQLRVEPSQRVHPGMYFSMNEHYARPAKTPPEGIKLEGTEEDTIPPAIALNLEGRRELLALLAGQWEGALAYAHLAAESVLSEGF